MDFENLRQRKPKKISLDDTSLFTSFSTSRKSEKNPFLSTPVIASALGFCLLLGVAIFSTTRPTIVPEVRSYSDAKIHKTKSAVGTGPNSSKRPAFDHSNSPYNHFAIGVWSNSSTEPPATDEIVYLTKVTKTLGISTRRANGEEKSIAESVWELYEAHPTASWYILIPRRSYAFLENIRIVLNEYSPASDAYFFALPQAEGTNGTTSSQKTCKPAQSKNIPSFKVNAGIILSRKALQTLQPHWKTCIAKDAYRFCAGQDVLLSLCLDEVGIPMDAMESLNDADFETLAWPRDPCRRPFTLGNLDDQTISRIYHSYRNLGADADGKIYKHDHLVTYSYLLSRVSQYKFSPVEYETDRPGSDIHHQNCRSGSECLKLCKTFEKCVAWTYNGHECWLKDSIGAKRPFKRHVSGVFSNNYRCDKE